MRLAIFGTGSQARVVLNIIQDLNEGARAGEKIDIAGFVYDRATQDQAHGHRLVQKNWTLIILLWQLEITRHAKKYFYGTASSANQRP